MSNSAWAALVRAALVLAVAAVATVNADTLGPAQTLYLGGSSGSGSALFTVQGNTLNLVNSAYGYEWGVVASTDKGVQTYAASATVQNGLSGQYTLGPTPTPTHVTYTNTIPPTTTYNETDDGTTDGKYNYIWSIHNGAAYRLSRDMTDPVLLFSYGDTDQFAGITYDVTNNSLWLSGWGSQKIVDVRFDGTLISSFDTGHMRNGSLALDSAGTLWLNNDLTQTLEGWSKSGTLLHEHYLGYYTIGGEFAFDPATNPSSTPLPPTALAALTLLPCLALRRRVSTSM